MLNLSTQLAPAPPKIIAFTVGNEWSSRFHDEVPVISVHTHIARRRKYPQLPGMFTLKGQRDF